MAGSSEHGNDEPTAHVMSYLTDYKLDKKESASRWRLSVAQIRVSINRKSSDLQGNLLTDLSVFTYPTHAALSFYSNLKMKFFIVFY
jgi:hypothetical protein